MVTFDEYKKLVETAMRTPVSPYIASEIEAMNEMTAQIEAIEAEHPEYELMWAEGLASEYAAQTA